MLNVRDMLGVAQQVETFQSRVQERLPLASAEMSARISRIYQAMPGMEPAAVAALALSGVPEQQIFEMYSRQQTKKVQQAQIPSGTNDWVYSNIQPGWHPPMSRPGAQKLLPPSQKMTEREYNQRMFDQFMEDNPGLRGAAENKINDAVGWTANKVLKPVANAGTWALDKITPDVVSDPFTDIARGTARWGFALTEYFPDLIQNITYGWLSNPQDAPTGLQAMWKKYGPLEGVMHFLANAHRATDFGNSMDRLLTKGGVDTGSGFFIDGEARQQADQNKYQVRGAYTGGPDMQTIPKSFGGSLGNLGVDLKIWDRDSEAYRISSGTVDAAVDILGDFSNYIGIGFADEAVRGLRSLDARDASKFADSFEMVTEANKVGNTALADDLMRDALQQIGVNTSTMTRSAVSDMWSKTDPARVAAVAVMRQEAGIIREGAKQYVILPEFAKFLTTGKGRSTINRLVEIKDADDIAELYKWRIGVRTANEIAEADNAETVIRSLIRGMADPAQDVRGLTAMMPHLGLFSIPDKKLWVQRKMQPYTRLGNLMPEGATLKMDEPNDFVRTVDTLMRVIPTNTGYKGGRYGADLRKHYVNSFIKAFADGDVEKVQELTDDLAGLFESTFTRLGYDSVTARELTTYVGNQDRIGTMRWMEQLQGVEPVNSAPILAAQLFQSATVIDETQLTRLIRDSGRLKTFLRNSSQYNKTVREYDLLNNKHRDLLDVDKVDEADEVAEQIAALKNRLAMAQRGEGGMPLPDDEFALAMMRSMSNLTERGLQFWKSIQLFRLAYILRTVPDDGARAYFSGAYRNIWDYFGAVMGSFDSMSRRGYGTYISAPDNTRWMRSARQINSLEAQMDAVRMKIAARDPKTQAKQIEKLEKDLQELERRSDVLFADFEGTSESLGGVLVSKNRTDALNLVDRQRFASQVQRGGHVMARKDNPQQVDNWVRGVMERVSFLSNDEPSKMIARAYTGIGLDDTKFAIGGVERTLQQHIDVLGRGQFDKIMANYFFDGPGKAIWEKYSTALARRGEQIDPASLGDALTWTREVMREMSYVAGQLNTSNVMPQLTINLLDNADPELLRAIATSRFKGKRIYEIQRGRGGAFDRSFNSNKEFADYVKEFRNNPDSPVAVFASSVADLDNEPSKLNVLGWFYQTLAGVPEDILVRDPLYRRILWKQTAQLIRLASPEEAAKIVANARKAKIDDDLLDLLITNSKVNLADGTVEEVMKFANAAAIEYQKEVLFDTMRRGSTADALRRVVAFGDAWYEGWKQWTSLIVRQRGKPVKSLMKGIEGGQDATIFGPDESFVWDPETGEYESIPEGKPSGLVYRDPTTGQFGYNIPWSQQFSKWALGKAGIDGPGMPMFVPLQNLNMLGNLSPGLGPLGAIVINPLLPDDPKADWLVNFLNPFGAPARSDTEAASAAGLSTLIPGYAQKTLPFLGQYGPTRPVVNALTNLFANSWWLNFQNNTMKQLMSTGNYDTTAEGSSQLLRDTERAASIYGLVFALAQFVGPGAPTARKLAEVRDPETGLVEVNVSSYFLIDDMNRIAREYVEAGEPPHKALEAMMLKWGPNIHAYNEPNTESRFPGSEATEQWWDWYRTSNNREFVERYPAVGAFFGGGAEEFSLETRNQLLSNGLMTPKQPEELLRDNRLNLTYYLYNVYRDTLPPENQRSREQKLALADYADQLERANQVSLNDETSRQRRQSQLTQLESMFESYMEGNREYAEVLESDTGWAVMQYLEFRREAQQQGLGRFNLGGKDSWATANGGASLRAGMRQRAQYLVAGYMWGENGWVKVSDGNPGFARLYSYVFDREMTGERDLEGMQRVEYSISGTPDELIQTGGR